MKAAVHPLLVACVLGWAGSVCAQDGQVLYEQLCGACHGNDGRGDRDGAHPPLADSAWIKGAPDRALQVVLHGLMGEIRVTSKHATRATYDLVMPPQGTLSDAQIADILTYVRSSWGNSEAAVTVAMVRDQRKATRDRNGFWMAGEILEKYPLQPPGPVKTAPPDVPESGAGGLSDKGDPASP